MIDLELWYCGQQLTDQKLSLAFAESATAGQATAEFALVPDSGKFLKGGLVCYDACLKEDVLGVPKQMIQQYTPESAEVTEAIAYGLRKIIPADIHIGITGLTAPGGSETSEKPVGTMFIHGLLYGKTLFSERHTFEGNPKQIIRQTIHYIAILLGNCLKSVNACKEASLNS